MKVHSVCWLLEPIRIDGEEFWGDGGGLVEAKPPWTNEGKVSTRDMMYGYILSLCHLRWLTL
jgi:hypothetical protein